MINWIIFTMICVGHQGAAGGVQGPSYYSASLRYPLCLPECPGQCSPSSLIVVPIFYTNNIHIHVQLYLCVCVLICTSTINVYQALFPVLGGVWERG